MSFAIHGICRGGVPSVNRAIKRGGAVPRMKGLTKRKKKKKRGRVH